MLIDVLSEGTILVSLSSEDMDRYSLDFGSDDGSSARAGLTRLLRKVGEDCGLDHRSKSYLIEALPGGSECLLIISVRQVKKRRVYRVKREKLYDCCYFASADDMLDFLHRGDDFGYRIYSVMGEYHLVPDLPPCERLAGILGEYGSVKRLSAVGTARLIESGTLIYERGTKRSRHMVRNGFLEMNTEN